jgi:hypothetical protein
MRQPVSDRPSKGSCTIRNNTATVSLLIRTRGRYFNYIVVHINVVEFESLTLSECVYDRLRPSDARSKSAERVERENNFNFRGIDHVNDRGCHPPQLPLSSISPAQPMSLTNKHEHPNAVSLQSAKLGFDHLFSNDIDAAKKTFQSTDDPFHLFGLGVCAFLEAALGMEVCGSISLSLNILTVISRG